MLNRIAESELILNKDGSVYHLNLHPHEIAPTVINVGDPDRVSVVSKFFDRVDVKKHKREFVTHTGIYKGKPVTVISTGIGTDNIDIVYNELDALINIDLNTRTIKDKLTSINLIRIGTSGALQADIPVDSFVFSSHGLGLDGLLNFYQLKNNADETSIIEAFKKHYPNNGVLPQSYISECSAMLKEKIADGMFVGMTASCSGFYAPQGRVLRLPLGRTDMIEKLNTFRHNQHRVTNFEMETGAMYGLAKLLGHHCCSVNVIVANRIAQQFSKNYELAMDNLIVTVLDRI